MSQEVTTKPASKAIYWTGWVISVLITALLLMGVVMALTQSETAVEGFKKYGYPDGILLTLGVVELACAVLYIVPQTAVLGAILLTGYLGGAVATHVHASESWILPVVVGVLAWGGLFLRDARIRALIPLRK